MLKVPPWRGLSRVEGRAPSLRGPAFIRSSRVAPLPLPVPRARCMSRVHGAALYGVDGVAVEVEVRISSLLPRIDIVGLPEAAVRESASRVRAAVGSIGAAFPDRRVTVSLAPASLRKSGAGLDLPIAIGILAAAGALGDASLDGLALLGELALDGRLRPVRGALALALAVRDAGCRRLIVPAGSAAEAALAPDLEVLCSEDLAAVVEHLREGTPLARAVPADLAAAPTALPDLCEVRGQERAKAALEVAAAGGHALLLRGAPGCGKTMLARRMRSLLPALDFDDALEVTRIHGAAGLHQGPGAARRRAPVSRPPPHGEHGRPARRRQSSPAGGDLARAPRRALPRRAARVRPAHARGPAPGARAATCRRVARALDLRLPGRFPAGRRREPLPLRLAAQRPARLPLRRRRARALPRAPLGPPARPHRSARARAGRALERARLREPGAEQRRGARARRGRPPAPARARKRSRLPAERRHPGRLPRRDRRGDARRARACSAARSTSSRSPPAPRAACSRSRARSRISPARRRWARAAVAEALAFRGDPEGCGPLR